LIAWFETLPETATGKIDRNAVIAAAAGTLTDL
jgi:hypothetical protein